jgi:hypothetical protein
MDGMDDIQLSNSSESQDPGQPGSKDHQDPSKDVAIEQQAPPMKRHAAMANLHLGHAHSAYDQKRRTQAEKKAADDAKAAAKEAQARIEQEKINRIAALELSIGQDTELVATPKPNGGRHLQCTEAYVRLPGSELMDVDGPEEQSDDDHDKDVDYIPTSEAPTEIEEDPRPKKKVKSSGESVSYRKGGPCD